jgi:hypothetical protein
MPAGNIKNERTAAAKDANFKTVAPKVVGSFPHRQEIRLSSVEYEDS